MKYFDPQIIKSVETQQQIREMVSEMLVARHLGYSAAAREMNVNRITFYTWFMHKDTRGSYLNVVRIVNWLMSHWPTDKEWTLKDLER
jgi:hypothetical protein